MRNPERISHKGNVSVQCTEHMPEPKVRSRDGTLTNMDPGTGWVTGKYGYGLNFDIENVKFAINREPEGNCSFAAIYEKCEAFPISPFGVDVAERLCRSDICLICEANQPHDYVDCVTLSLNNKEL